MAIIYLFINFISMNNSALFIILLIITNMLSIYFGGETVETKYNYHINLEQDSILIHNQYKDTTIHFDDLEEYLIKDNI